MSPYIILLHLTNPSFLSYDYPAESPVIWSPYFLHFKGLIYTSYFMYISVVSLPPLQMQQTHACPFIQDLTYISHKLL